jgi:hypothetical protein
MYKRWGTKTSPRTGTFEDLFDLFYCALTTRTTSIYSPIANSHGLKLQLFTIHDSHDSTLKLKSSVFDIIKVGDILRTQRSSRAVACFGL